MSVDQPRSQFGGNCSTYQTWQMWPKWTLQLFFRVFSSRIRIIQKNEINAKQRKTNITNTTCELWHEFEIIEIQIKMTLLAVSDSWQSIIELNRNGLPAWTIISMAFNDLTFFLIRAKQRSCGWPYCNCTVSVLLLFFLFPPLGVYGSP